MTSREDLIAKELFKTYKISLVNYCIRKYKYSNEDSQEFVAETFCRLTDNIKQVADRSPAEQRAWLFSTLTNVISEHNRKRKFLVKEEIETFEIFLSDKDKYEQIIEDDTYNKIINDIKLKLKDNEKIYFESFIQNKYNYKEIARSEGINYNTFKSQMLRISPIIRKIALEVIKEHDLTIDKTTELDSKQD